MLRKPLSWSVKQVCSMINKGTISFDNPIQRPSGQWKDANKSLLIHSLLTMFMPDVYAIQTSKEVDGKKTNIYDIIDGKQRLTTIASFINNEWTLTVLPMVKLESTGEKYDISSMKFSELPEEVQDEIKGYTITFKAIELEEEDDEETIVDDIFYRLNNGTPVSREHMALVQAKRNVQSFVKDTVKNHDLFTKVAHYADGDIKKSNKEMAVLQTIALVSGIDYNSFAAKDIEKLFAENDITDDVLSNVNDLFTMVSEVFDDSYNKFVTKISISAMANLLNEFKDNSDSVKEFLKWYSENNKKGDNYKRYCGAGCTKKDNVKKRMSGLIELYNEWLKNQDVQIIEKEGM